MGILLREYYLKQPRVETEDIYKEANRPLQEPSELSVALCITHAIMPKEMKSVHSDNGLNFHAEALRRAVPGAPRQAHLGPSCRTVRSASQASIAH